MAIETPPASLGSPCPDFRLRAVDGKTYSSADFAPGPLVVMFICNHCPYVKAVEDRLIRLAREYATRGVQFVGICANDAAGYPDDAFDKLAARWRDKGYGFPYLHDESQAVARTFGAVCTPDIFVYDRSRRLAYRGRIDDSWKDEIEGDAPGARRRAGCFAWGRSARRRTAAVDGLLDQMGWKD